MFISRQASPARGADCLEMDDVFQERARFLHSPRKLEKVCAKIASIELFASYLRRILFFFPITDRNSLKTKIESVQ